MIAGGVPIWQRSLYIETNSPNPNSRNDRGCIFSKEGCKNRQTNNYNEKKHLKPERIRSITSRLNQFRRISKKTRSEFEKLTNMLRGLRIKIKCFPLLINSLGKPRSRCFDICCAKKGHKPSKNHNFVQKELKSDPNLSQFIPNTARSRKNWSPEIRKRSEYNLTKPIFLLSRTINDVLHHLFSIILL